MPHAGFAYPLQRQRGVLVSAVDRRHHVQLGAMLGVGATLMFAFADTLSKYLARDYPVNQVAFARYAVPLLFVCIVYGPQYGFGLFRTRHPAVQLLRGVLLVICTLTIVLAMRLMPIAEAQSISFVHPLLLMLLAVLFLHEKVHPLSWVAIALGFGGVIVIVRPGGGFDTSPALLPLAMALCYAGYQALTRHVTARDAAINSLFYVMLVGTVVTGVSLLFVDKMPGSRDAALFVCAGLCSGGGHFLMIRALGSSPASKLAPVAYVQVLWVIMLGVLFFGNFPAGLTLLGIALIVAGGLLATLARRAAPSTASITGVIR